MNYSSLKNSLKTLDDEYKVVIMIIPRVLLHARTGSAFVFRTSNRNSLKNLNDGEIMAVDYDDMVTLCSTSSNNLKCLFLVELQGEHPGVVDRRILDVLRMVRLLLPRKESFLRLLVPTILCIPDHGFRLCRHICSELFIV
jgi:hypothetical protein